MNTKIDVLIPEEDIRKRISEMAAELSEKYKGEEVLLVGILTGSVFFLAEVEDIVDTGQTLHLLTEMLIERNPASLELAVLLNKPSRRKVCLDADYVGFDIPDAFVVGWGLDYDQKYRDLPYIGVIKE